MNNEQPASNQESQREQIKPSLPTINFPEAEHPRVSVPKGVAGGFAGINARTREKAAAKLPPSLRAKLEENARLSSLASPTGTSGSATVMGHAEKIDPSLLMPCLLYTSDAADE